MPHSAAPLGGREQRRQRLSELLMAISLATDLGAGHPMGHTLRSCYLSVALAKDLGCTPDEVRSILHHSLLRILGCTSDASETARLTGGDDRAFNAAMDLPVMGSQPEMLAGLFRSLGKGHSRLARARMLLRALSTPGGPEQTIASHCEVAAMLGRRLGLGDDVVEALGHGFERWDGKGYPSHLSGEEIPAPARIALVASDAELLLRMGEDPADCLSERAGRAYDPDVVDAFLKRGAEHIAGYDASDGWDAVLDSEPEPVTMIPDSETDRVLGVFADFADIKSPWTRGHSPAVAELAERAGRELGLDIDERRALRRAGLVHDVGRVGVENGIWDKPGRLSAEEWERVRLHPYLTGRVLSRCGALAPLADLAASHHERLDGSGYHRGCGPGQLPLLARILAVADVFSAACEERPYRPAMSRSQAADLLEGESHADRLDSEAVAAVLAAAGMEPAAASRRTWPAGLTEREVEVLRLIARGRTNRQTADALSISPKTVGRHIENIYGKIDVSTRAGATLFAMEQRLLD